MPMTMVEPCAVLGDAQAVVDRAVAARRIEARGCAHVCRRHAGDRFHRFRRVALGWATKSRHFSNESTSQRARTKSSFDQPFGHDHVRDALISATLVPGRSFR